MNISRKLLLIIWIALLTMQYSWSQSITITGYTCTGAGSATLALTPNTGITSYVWQNASTNMIVDTTSTTTQPSGSYSVIYVKGGLPTTVGPFTVAAGIVPTTSTVTPSTVSTPLCGTASSSQTLTSSTVPNYSWNLDGAVLSPPVTANSLNVLGNSAPAGTHNYSVTTTNTTTSCSATSNAVAIIIVAKPASPVISPSTFSSPICSSSTQTLTASNIGSAVYVWKRNGVVLSGSTTNSIVVTGTDVSTPGTYNYTVSSQNSSGCASDDSAPVYLSISPKPYAPTITPATFNPNVICGSDVRTLTATGGGSSYTWKRNGGGITNSTTNSLNVVGTDVAVGGTYVYTVSLTNSIGCVSDDSQPGVTLQLFPTLPQKPTITANGSATFCQGGSVILNYNRGINSDIKIWSRTSGADTTTANADGITVRSTNSFTVKTKDSNGCFSPSSNSFLVTVNSLPDKPIIDKGTSDAICETDSITLTSNNKGTGNYLWNTGKITTSITVRTAGTYSLTYTDTNSCTSLPSFPLALIVNPLPAKPTIINLNKSQFCYREFTSLRASSTTSGAIFQWDYRNQVGNQIDVAGSSKMTQNETINISVRAISVFSNSSVNNFCKSRVSSDFVTITVYPLPTTPNITVSGPITFCPDSTVNLTSTTSPNGVYQWINTKDASQFSNQQTVLIDTTSKFFTITPVAKIGKFYVRTISDKSCLSDTSQNVVIKVRNAPLKGIINPSPISATVCKGEKVTLDVLLSNGNINRYSWRNEKTKREITILKTFQVDTSGTYSVRLRDVFGCFAENSAPVTVLIRPLPAKPIISIVKSKAFCDGDSTIVQSSFPTTTVNGNKNLYRWIVDGQTVLESTSRIFSWKKASSISVAVKDTNGCKALVASDTIRTTVNPLPVSPSITVRGPIPFCADKSVILSAIGANGVTYKWSTGAITADVTTNVAGTVTVQAVNVFGCLSKPSQGVQVRVNPSPIAPKLTANGETTFCEGSKVRIVSSSSFQSYWWRSTTDSIGKGNDLISIFASITGNYFAKVQDDNGCISLASATLAVDARPNPTPTIIKQIGAFLLDAQGVGDENRYIWRLNDVIKPELTTRIIKAKQDGNYKVQASILYTGLAIAGGKLVCYSNTSDALKYVEDLSFDGFSIYPNPSPNGEINVEVIEDLIGANITIYDLYGQLIAEYKVDNFSTFKKIQLPNYHGNTYIVKITKDGLDRTRRVITLRL